MKNLDQMSSTASLAIKYGVSNPFTSLRKESLSENTELIMTQLYGMSMDHTHWANREMKIKEEQKERVQLPILHTSASPLRPDKYMHKHCRWWVISTVFSVKDNAAYISIMWSESTGLRSPLQRDFPRALDGEGKGRQVEDKMLTFVMNS